MEKISIMAVLPNNQEYFEDIHIFPHQTLSAEYNSIASKAVSKAGITTSRTDPQFIEVKIYRLEIKKGKLEKVFLKICKIQPPLERMREVEYKSEMKQTLAMLPEEFRDYVLNKSYEEGHSSGYEECINIADEIVDNLRPIIERYTKRIQGVQNHA